MAKRPTKAKTPRVREVALEERPALAPAIGPIPLGEVLGQDRAVGVLEDAMRSGRVHHAWVFHGPEGVGKFTTALALAATLLDPTTGPDLAGRHAPDPQSPVQRLIRAGAHPDLSVITRELAAVSRDERVRAGKQMSIAKEVLAEFVVEPAARTRAVPGASLAGKVFIIDGAEAMAREGQNALLKTLEEPPPGTVLIMVTASEDRLLPTIRSRAQRVAFGPLPEPAMRRWLEAHAGDIDAERREWLAAFAAGSPGLFERALEADFYAWHRQLEPRLAAADAGRYVPDLGEVIRALVEERAQAVVKENARASKESANREAASQMLRLIGERYRRRLTGGDPETALRAIDAVQRAHALLERNVSLQFVGESLAVALASPEPVA